jgi:hypothetical protein
MWSECSCVTRIASILSSVSPIAASRAIVSRRLNPVSIKMRVDSVRINAQLPELDDAKTQNLKMAALPSN